MLHPNYDPNLNIVLFHPILTVPTYICIYKDATSVPRKSILRTDS